MKLLLMRHGNAGKPNSTEYPDDRLRPLTRPGREEISKLASLYYKMQLRPTLCLCSPFLRALETAQIFCETNKTTLLEEERLASGAGFGNYQEVLQENFIGQNALLMVGHEPDLSKAASALLGINTAERLPISFTPGGLAILEIASIDTNSHPAKIIAFFPPTPLLLL
ncbi:MAG: histidine phosphatase family protein [Oligoflexia bacterium]|nr:histidine phosphatase family protein [Oligoflexia bacterium]